MAKKTSSDFSENTRKRTLLWCRRHCCYCGKPSGPMLQLHHIGGRKIKNASDIDNAVPLCLTCHAEVHLRTNMGNAISANELKAIRDQVYNEHTNRFVPKIKYHPFQEWKEERENGIKLKYELPEVGFWLEHADGFWPAKVWLTILFPINGAPVKAHKPYYKGIRPWHLNTSAIHLGHFRLPTKVWNHYKDADEVTAVVQVKIEDAVQYTHRLLDVAYTLTKSKKSAAKPGTWFFEPSPP